MSNHERPEKLRATAFDGLAAALSPALIIGMIGSLVFFLVIAFYRGQYDARLMYILALYTAATVLVARIAIESDRARAAAFAVPLAIAAMLGMMRFVTINGDWAALSWIVNIGLLGLTYYLADRITFDCTLLEEDRESLQGGLLQTIGSSVAVSACQMTVAQRRAALFNPPAQPRQSGEDAANRSTKASKQPIGAARLKKAKHNPGVWVLYFALIAFPLFGVGQLVIPDERQRSIAFWCLVAYLGCALALLMTTSLLGMRRYLRQRGAMMPPDITAKWLVAGGLITCAILVVCMLMPLPGKQLSVAGLKIELTSPDNLTTSKFGWGNDGKNDGQAGQATEQSQGEGEGEGEGDKQGQESKQGQGNKQGQENKQGNAQGKAPQGDQGQTSENSQGQSENSDSPQSEPGQSNDQNKNSSQPSDKGQQASDKGDQGQPGGQQGQANDPAGKAQQGPQDRSSQNQNNNETKEQQSAKANDQGNKPQGNDRKNNRDNNRDNNKPNDQPNKQPNKQPDQAGKQPPDEPNPNNNQPQQAQAEPPESEPLRAGNSLSQTSRSLASSLLDTLKTLGSLFKWLLIAVLAGIVIFFVVTNFEEVKRLITDLMNFINALLGRRSNPAPAIQSDEEPAVSGPTRRPFNAFPNPFSRSLQGWQGPQVVQHTFAALEAWAAQRGRVRAVDQTAEEFARKLVAQEPELERLPLQAASMLDRVMFAGWQPSRQEVAALEQLWDRMSART